MQANYEEEIDGVTYVSQPETYKGSCEGCIARFAQDDSLCSDLQNNCHELGVIFIKKENQMQQTQAQPEVTSAEDPKYTVEEVLEAVEEVTDDYILDHQKKQIRDILEKKNNPDYKLYLELKAKFGE